MNLKQRLMELRQKKADLHAKATALVEAAAAGDGLTDETRAELDGLKVEAASNDALITEIEALIDSERSIDGTALTVDSTDLDAAQSKNPSPKPFRSFGEQLQAIIEAETPGKGAYVHPGLNELNAAASGMSSGIGSDGGFMIQEDFSSKIFHMSLQQDEITPRCREIGLTGESNAFVYNKVDETSRVEGSRYGGVQVYWAAEADTVTAKKPKFKKERTEVEKLMGLCYLTDELMEDAPSLQAFVSMAFSDEIAFKRGDAIIRGSGVGQYLGLLNSPALVTVSKETGQLADTILKANIDKMWSRMPVRLRKNAVWLINQDIEPQLEDLQMVIGTGGVPVYLPPGGISATPYGNLKGRPVIPIEQAATLGDKGDIILADLSHYLRITKGGVKQATSMHVRFLYGEQALRFTSRENGKPLLDSAITPANGSATLSSHVALEARA